MIVLEEHGTASLVEIFGFIKIELKAQHNNKIDQINDMNKE